MLYLHDWKFSGLKLACSRLSDSGKDAKEKGTRKIKVGGPDYPEPETVLQLYYLPLLFLNQTLACRAELALWGWNGFRVFSFVQNKMTNCKTIIKLMKAEQIFIIHHVLCFCRYCMEQTCLFEITMATHPFILRQERVMLKLSKKCLEKVRLYFGILQNRESYIKQMSLHLQRLVYFSKTSFFVRQLFFKIY